MSLTRSSTSCHMISTILNDIFLPSLPSDRKRTSNILRTSLQRVEALNTNSQKLLTIYLQ